MGGSEGLQAQDAGPRGSLRNQVIAMLICNLAAFSLGAAVGWLSPWMSALQAEDGPLRAPLSELQLALCGGLICAGGFLGLPVFSYVARAKGRKAAAYVTGVPFAAGFALKLWTDDARWLLLARFLCGLGGAGANGLPALYAAECVEPRARGALAALQVVMFSVGTLAAYSLGALLPYRACNACLLLPPLLFLLGFWFLPETPVYRLRRGQEEEAARAVAWLRRLPLNGPEVRAELRELGRGLPCAARELEALAGRKPLAAAVPEAVPSVWRRAGSSPATRRGLLLCAALVLTQTLMGLFAVSSYAAPVLQAAAPGLSLTACSVLYALVMLGGTASCSLLVDRLGRRALQLGSCAGVGACELVLGACFQLSTAAVWRPPAALPLVALLLCAFLFNAGAGSMPFVIVGEVFELEVREFCSNAVLMLMWLCSFFLLQLFPWCISRLGIHTVFYFFAGCSLLSGALYVRWMPETAGRSLQQVQQLLASGRR